MAISVDQVAAVVLAGGFGTRVRHLLPGVPKPMAPVCGKPFLEWVIRYLAREGLKRVVLSTGYLSGVIESYFQSQPIPGVCVTCAVESQPLGTAGGFLNAVEVSGEKPAAWLVLNGDSLCFTNVERMLEEAAGECWGGAIVGCQVPDAARYGTLSVKGDGSLAGFQEKRPGAGLINAGMYLLKAPIISEFPGTTPLSFELDVFPLLARHGKPLRVFRAEGPFLDIGTPESLGEATEFISSTRTRFAT